MSGCGCGGCGKGTKMDTINDLVGQIAKAPITLLLILALVIVGYVLKSIESIPNKFIPLILMALGAVAMAFLGDTGAVNPETRYPVAVLAVQGVIFAFVAWLLHAQILKRFMPAGSLLEEQKDK